MPTRQPTFTTQGRSSAPPSAKRAPGGDAAQPPGRSPAPAAGKRSGTGHDPGAIEYASWLRQQQRTAP